jgi:hypothetical protein
MSDIVGEHVWNVGKIIPDYTAQLVRTQPSCNIFIWMNVSKTDSKNIRTFPSDSHEVK